MTTLQKYLAEVRERVGELSLQQAWDIIAEDVPKLLPSNRPIRINHYEKRISS